MDNYGTAVVTQFNFEHTCFYDPTESISLGVNVVPLLTRALKEKLFKSSFKKNLTRIEDLGIWIPDSTLKIAYNACQRAYGRGTNIGRIPSLCEEIRRLGGFAWWQPVDATSPTKTLYRVFASLPPTSQFFGRYVPPGIVVDGTYMRNGTNMSLLTAIMRTGENHIIPLAIALVPNETASNWEFFFSSACYTRYVKLTLQIGGKW